MPKRTSTQPMARRARHGTCRVNEVRLLDPPPNEKQKARHKGGLFVLAGRLGPYESSLNHLKPNPMFYLNLHSRMLARVSALQW
jgi:hypothetical protein